MAAVAVGYLTTSSNESEMNVSDLTSANVGALAQALPPDCVCVKGGVYCECNGYFSWGKEKRIVEEYD